MRQKWAGKEFCKSRLLIPSNQTPDISNQNSVDRFFTAFDLHSPPESLSWVTLEAWSLVRGTIICPSTAYDICSDRHRILAKFILHCLYRHECIRPAWSPGSMTFETNSLFIITGLPLASSLSYVFVLPPFCTPSWLTLLPFSSHNSLTRPRMIPQ